MQFKSTRFLLVLLLLSLGLAGGVARADADEAPRPALARTLLAANAWLSVPGRPDHLGIYQFMPLPAGILDPVRNVYVGNETYTLRPNQGLGVPIFYWFGEEYVDGSQDPPDFPAPGDFLGADVLVTLDGVPIVDSAVGLEDFYVDTAYYPRLLQYPEPTSYGSVGTYFVKGLCVQIGPMSPGVHELKILATSSFIEGLAGFRGWDNTWVITVEK